MRRAAVATAILGLLLGCTPAPAVTTPAPTLTFACTPEAGGTPKPCSQAEYDAMVKKDALYAEAEALYRRLFAEEIRLDKLGGAKAATSEFEAILAGSLLEQTIAIHRENYERDRRFTGRQTLDWIRRAPGIETEGSLVAIIACRDATHGKTYEGKKYLGTGRAGTETVYAKHFDGQLKLFAVDSKELPTCDKA